MTPTLPTLVPTPCGGRPRSDYSPAHLQILCSGCIISDCPLCNPQEQPSPPPPGSVEISLCLQDLTRLTHNSLH